jgi:hypothetical protein
MDIVHERAAGLGISKRDAKVCLRLPGQRAGPLPPGSPPGVRLPGRSLRCGTFWNASM